MSKLADKEFKEIPIGVRWEWDEVNNCLTYKANVTQSEKIDKKKGKDQKIDLRYGVPRLVTQTRAKLENKYEAKKPPNSVVTINDVKTASLYMLSERYYIPREFENYCNDSSSKVLFEMFLLELVNYFHWFFEDIDSKTIINPMCIEKNEIERRRIAIAEQMLIKSLKSLARYYCKLILGLGMVDYHHMNGGKSRASCGFRDRGIYETLYPFCIFFVWITFKRRDHEKIRKEIGRLLRSDSFNSTLKVENILEDEISNSQMIREIQNKDKDAILNNHKENKAIFNDFQAKIDVKMSSMILNQRSPALVSILPRPEENSKQLFHRKKTAIIKKSGRESTLAHKEKVDEARDFDDEQYELLQEVGIIGQPLKLFHLKTLAVRGNNENNENDTENQPEQNEETTANQNSVVDIQQQQAPLQQSSQPENTSNLT